jgi:iron complex outermembrane receptor protein
VGGADKFEPFSKREHDANYQSIKYQHLYSDTGTVQLTAYHNYLDLETPAMSFERVADYIGTQNPAIVNGFIALNSPREDSEHGTTHSYDTELQLTDRIGSLELVGGLGYRYETAESDVLLQSGKVTEERWRLFSNLDWDFALRWSLSSGFMYEDSSENSDALSYRHALIHRPDEQSSIRLGYSISERLPSLLERNGNNTIYAPAGVFGPDPVVYDLDKAANPDLGPERIKTYEIGYYRAFSDQQGHIDLRLFHERLTNVISTYYLPVDELAPPPFPMTQGRVSTSMNNFGWENQGIEIQLQRQLSSQLSALLNYTYTNTRTDRWETNKDLMGEAMIFRDAITPEHTASIMLNWTPTSDLNLSLMHYYMDSVHWFEGSLRDSYQRTDLRAAHNWQLSGGTELEAAVTIQNAFGPTYEEFYQYNLFDRRAWLQLTLRYH